jgi:CRP-like cAMP-binding protein
MMKADRSSMKDQRFSIIQRVIDGSLKIDSIKEFEEILDIYPDDPLLNRKYADLLHRHGRRDEAEKSYDDSAKLFLQQGMNLQAIVSKILKWSIRKPDHEEGRSFHLLLHEEGAKQTPLQRFWARLSYPELVSTMLRLVRMRIPSGEKVLPLGAPVEDLYFVVTGMLSETPTPDCEYEAAAAGFQTEPIVLGPNDIFGDIFPIDDKTTSRVEIRSITEVELVKISKSVLRSVCIKHPQIEKLLVELHKKDRLQKCDRAWQTVRRTFRFGLPTHVDITGHPPHRSDRLWHHSGIALDLSIGGMCIDMGTHSFAPGQGQPKGQIVQVSLDLGEDALLNVSGVVVWYRKLTGPQGGSSLMGIRFDPMSPSHRRVLINYCSGDGGEQNLLWSLWDTMVRMDNQ